MMRAARDLQVVVQEPDHAETHCGSTAIQMCRLVRSAQSSVGTTAAVRISSPPIVGVPALAMRLRSFLPDDLTDLEIAQCADQPWANSALIANAGEARRRCGT